MSVNASSAAFFEAKYRSAGDPWNYAADEYELGKYDATLQALAGRRYRRAFEPGCSVGVLTERLAQICDALEAIDFSETAVANAKARCAHLKNVSILCSSLPERLPLLGFDLVVLSEIGYYFRPEEWVMLVENMVRPLERGATVVGVHWLGSSQDHEMSGDEVHKILRADARLRLTHEERHGEAGVGGFRLDRWVRV